MQTKSRIIRLSIVGGIVAVGLTSSILTNFGTADTNTDPTVSPSPVETVQAATPVPTPSPTPIASPAPVTIQQQLDNHESRITALENTQAVTVPVSQLSQPEPTIATTPAPITPTCQPTAHGNICIGN